VKTTLRSDVYLDMLSSYTYVHTIWEAEYNARWWADLDFVAIFQTTATTNTSLDFVQYSLAFIL